MWQAVIAGLGFVGLVWSAGVGAPPPREATRTVPNSLAAVTRAAEEIARELGCPASARVAYVIDVEAKTALVVVQCREDGTTPPP